MSETTATHDVDFEVTWEDEWPKMVIRASAIKTDAAIMGRELTEQEREFIEMVDKAVKLCDEETGEIPVGWLCPRCGAVNAPDVKRCECDPRPEDLRVGVLPSTVVGPRETK